MTQPPSLRRHLIKVVAYPLLALFVLPLASVLFTGHVIPVIDNSIQGSIESSIQEDAELGPAEKAEWIAFYRAHPASAACLDYSEQATRYREAYCEPGSAVWQFKLADIGARFMLAMGGLILLVVAALGALAFANRQARYWSFVAGWRLLVVVSAVEVIAQGALVVWLSYWATVYFGERYYPKLILVAGILVAVAAYTTVTGIFRRVSCDTELEGELLSPQAAPAFWGHVRALAERLQTETPVQIVAGIDANFFVTEAPLKVGDRAIQGRTLYVSLPLLGLMSRGEADAVLAHELAHLSGGDAASSAALGPRLVQYDHYCDLLASVGATRPVFYLMQLYRVIFEFALKRESRAREFLADRTAVSLACGRDLVQALIKLTAYASYRGTTEQRLSEHNQRLEGGLGIAEAVASGLAPYARSEAFIETIRSSNVPHPFDSHPALPERMVNAGHVVTETEMAEVAATTPQACWLDDIPTADEIEQRLWSVYERNFADAHEEQLAYRYEPADETQREIVLKYFPPVSFALKKGQQVEIRHDGIQLPEREELLGWDSVKDLNYESGLGADVLKITHPEKTWRGARTTKIRLSGMGKQRDAFKQALGHYWQRHQIMRENLLDVS